MTTMLRVHPVHLGDVSPQAEEETVSDPDAYRLLEHAPIPHPGGDEVWSKARVAQGDRAVAEIFADRPTPADPVTPLDFSLPPDDSPPDYIATDVVGAHLCSQHMVDALARLSVPMRLYPVTLLNLGTGEPYSRAYYCWIPQQLEDAIDWQRSEIWTDPETGERILTNMVLTDSIERSAAPLFSPTGRIEVLVGQLSWTRPCEMG
jgi:hypothetical protein